MALKETLSLLNNLGRTEKPSALLTSKSYAARELKSDISFRKQGRPDFFTVSYLQPT